MSAEAAGWALHKPVQDGRRLAGDWAARRFWPKVRFGLGCWEWAGAMAAHGYGHVHHDGRYPHAHRVAYELLRGPIPVGLVIDHLCRNRLCVNPGHMEAVTIRENLLRGDGFAARHAGLTHCPQGHEYTPDNTQVSKRNQRHCRTCRRERARTARAGLLWP